MAKSKKSQSVISIKALSEKSGLAHMKVYLNLNGQRNSLTHDDKRKLVSTFYDETRELLKQLGYFIKIHPIKGQD